MNYNVHIIFVLCIVLFCWELVAF